MADEPPVPCMPNSEVRIDLVVGRRMHGAHLAPVGVQFLGDQRGEAGEGSLAHLDVLAQDRHRVVGADLDEGVHDRQRIVAAAVGALEPPARSLSASPTGR